MRRICLAIAVLLLSGNVLLAQEQGDMKSQLQTVSQQMASDGNYNYIIVEAYLDGFQKDNSNFNLDYNKGAISINGRQLSGKMLAKYDGLLKQRYQAVHQQHIPQSELIAPHFVWTIDAVRVADMLDPTTPFRLNNSQAVHPAE